LCARAFSYSDIDNRVDFDQTSVLRFTEKKAHIFNCGFEEGKSPIQDRDSMCVVKISETNFFWFHVE
jgi:hypothetical protein